MSKKKLKDKDEQTKIDIEISDDENDEKIEDVEDVEDVEEQDKNVDDDVISSEKNEIEAELEKCINEKTEYLNRLQRMAAEFENYKKRTAKEKDAIYCNSVADVVGKLLPAVDNLERAINAAEEANETGTLLDGVEMVYKQFIDSIDDIGVKPIESVGEAFNPEYHNAVMHIEDEDFGENEVVEEFQKGYIYKDTSVVRHAMVKVAN